MEGIKGRFIEFLICRTKLMVQEITTCYFLQTGHRKQNKRKGDSSVN